MSEEIAKEKLGLVIIGHIDAGKSTLCGRLLVENGGIDKRQMTKLEQEAVGMGRGSFKYAFAMDLTKAERTRGITINSTVKNFETKRFAVTIVDAPGHKDFIKNMITGTCTADAAILVIDGTPGGFEAGISSRGQTRQHAQLAFASGVTSLIVAVNKMDAVDEKDQEERFNMIKNEIGNILKKIGFFKSTNYVPYVPISAFQGRNLSDRSTAYSWSLSWKYQVARKGEDVIHLEGVTLIDAIDSVVKPPSPDAYPLRACITDSFTLPGFGAIATISLNYGIITVGMLVRLEPAGIDTSIRSCELHRVAYEVLPAIAAAAVILKGVLLKFLKRGAVIGPRDDPPYEVIEFLVRLLVMAANGFMGVGYRPVVDTNTSHIPCAILAILKNKKSKQHMELESKYGENVDFITTGDTAEVNFSPKGPMVIELTSRFPRYARISVRDSGIVVAIGSCISRVCKDKFDKAQKAAMEKAAKAKAALAS